MKDRSQTPAIPAPDRCELEGKTMGKGNNKRGNKEAKKPKAEKPKVSATANTLAGKSVSSLGAKKMR
ncbi:hypothetical protein [Pikeienuella sp. HZG-20]|uniref:hypothetical protein n=1 Tax=Paludibacillus litoralis TaxID=3133267 RepID=UPI0030EDD7C6